jgi:hypothetical protein
MKTKNEIIEKMRKEKSRNLYVAILSIFIIGMMVLAVCGPIYFGSRGYGPWLIGGVEMGIMLIGFAFLEYKKERFFPNWIPKPKEFNKELEKMKTERQWKIPQLEVKVFALGNRDIAQEISELRDIIETFKVEIEELEKMKL